MFKSKGRKKKTSEISSEKFGVNEKVLTFAPAFSSGGLQKPTICNVKAEAKVLKNFEKKDAKIFGGERKLVLSLHPLSLQKRGGSPEKKEEFFKILKGDKKTASAIRSFKKNDEGIMPGRKR